MDNFLMKKPTFVSHVTLIVQDAQAENNVHNVQINLHFLKDNVSNADKMNILVKLLN